MEELKIAYNETVIALCKYGAAYHAGKITAAEMTGAMEMLINEWEIKASRANADHDYRINNGNKLRRKMARLMLEYIR